MGLLGLLVMALIILVVIWNVVVSPLIYLFTPSVERNALVVSVDEHTSTTVKISHPSEPFSRKTETDYSYSVTLRFDDGTSGGFSCSHSMYKKLYRGARIVARTKRDHLSGIK